MSGAIGDCEASAGQASACAGDPHKMQHEDDPQNLSASEPITILDVLNMDCWRAVLDWLDVDDVVRSERVSRGWQRVVQEYLQGVHSYDIDSYICSAYKTHLKNNSRTYHEKYSKYHKLKSKANFCEEMFKKMGPFIVTLLADNFSQRWMDVMTENCPNLEDVTFWHLKDDVLLDGLVNCKRLKRVELVSTWLSEADFERLIIQGTLEELVIDINPNVSGDFLGCLKSTNLNKLALNQCSNLNIQHILSAASLLTELTALELNYPPKSTDIFEKVHLLLDKTPKLEHLSLNVCVPRYLKRNFTFKLNNELVESVGRLSCLKHLSMQMIATDALLKAVARGCKELRTLNIAECPGVSGPVLVSLCRELPALTELYVAGTHNLSDEHLAACITACPSLTMLDMAGCKQVTVALVAAAARDVRRRPRPLRLRLLGTAVTSDIDQALFAEEKSMGLALSWCRTSKIQYYEDSDSDIDFDIDSDIDSDIDFDIDFDSDRDYYYNYDDYEHNFDSDESNKLYSLFRD